MTEPDEFSEADGEYWGSIDLGRYDFTVWQYRFYSIDDAAHYVRMLYFLKYEVPPRTSIVIAWPGGSISYPIEKTQSQ